MNLPKPSASPRETEPGQAVWPGRPGGPASAADDGELAGPIERPFGLSRRRFMGMLGAGWLITVGAGPVVAQRRGGGAGRREGPIAARIHIGQDGIVTVLTGKVEMGQGSRAELTQAAAEELRLSVDQIRMLMADTSVVPDDGTTAGSRTTPSTVPAVRRAAAAAREVLMQLASHRWEVNPAEIELRDGILRHNRSERLLTYAELARTVDLPAELAQSVPADVTLTPLTDWTVLGQSVPRPNRRDLVTGTRRFPSDVVRPGMWYGRVLRPPAYGATLASIDLEPARAMEDVVVVRDGSFIGVAAPTRHRARQALARLAENATWERASHPSSREIPDYLRERADGGVPSNPFPVVLEAAHQRLRATYLTAYVQHAPLEPRAAVAEWKDDGLTVWAGTQSPFGYHRELANAFGLSNDQVRVVVPDFGCGFGGKHTGEAAVEAARLARGANRPVSLRWTREEEFAWAYFRPAAVIETEATLDRSGALTSWFFVNINSGGSAVDTPYQSGATQCRFVRSDSPLRQGSYRALAATANNFARESFMDELAAAAGTDPLEFRLAHLQQPRLRAVLEEAAQRFDWRRRVREKQPDRGVGLACGTEKGSYVAACVAIRVDRAASRIVVEQVCEVFECGAVVNPGNLRAQMASCILMGLGPALREEMRFERGIMRNATFAEYHVPRFSDVPELDLHLLNRPDLPSAGGGETPIIAIAPAIANALFQATGTRVREMPIRLPAPA